MISRLFNMMIIGVLLFTVDLLGQNTWVKTFGGSGDDDGNSIATTKDGGYVLTGVTSSNDGDFSRVNKGHGDIFVTKLNKNGDTVWQKSFGGSIGRKSDMMMYGLGISGLDVGNSITTTTDNCYVLTGYTSSDDGDFSGMLKGYSDILVMKLNQYGDTKWQKIIGGEMILGDYGNSITTTKDGGYVLTGYTSSNDGDFSGMLKGEGDIFVIKLNHNGDTVWKKTFGGGSRGMCGDNGNSITTTTDGGLILTGDVLSRIGDFSEMWKGFEEIFVMRLNQNGDTVWKKTFGGSSGDHGRSITTTSDGGCVLTGYTDSNDGDFSGLNKGGSDIFVIKLNSSGNIVWKKTFGGKNNDYGLSITTSTDGGFVLTGGTSSNDGNFKNMNNGDEDIFIMKLNSRGIISWKKTFGGKNSDCGHTIITSSDGGYVLTGVTNSDDGDFSGINKGGNDIFVMKIDKNGKLFRD